MVADRAAGKRQSRFASDIPDDPADERESSALGLEISQRCFSHRRDLATITDKVALLQSVTAQKLQVADSLLAQLDSQQSVLTGVLLSVNNALYGTRTN
jgi:hypothetical protein